MTKETTVTLFVFRHTKGKLKGEIYLATFDKAIAGELQLAGKKVEEHQAKSETTRGMYGKLFGLSGAQKLGGAARFEGKSEKEKAKTMLNVRNGRKRFASNPKPSKVKAEKKAKK